MKVFEDEACEKEFKLSDKIDFTKLTTAGPLKLWLRGKTAGKFTAKLELEASSDPNALIEPHEMRRRQDMHAIAGRFGHGA